MSLFAPPSSGPMLRFDAKDLDNVERFGLQIIAARRDDITEDGILDGKPWMIAVTELAVIAARRDRALAERRLVCCG